MIEHNKIIRPIIIFWFAVVIIRLILLLFNI